MVKQYPNSIRIDWKGKSTQDDDGYLVPKEVLSFEGICRAEPNGKGRTISSPDGSLIDYSYTVFMPKGITVRPPVGAKVTLNLYGSTIEGAVKRFDQNYFNATLWL